MRPRAPLSSQNFEETPRKHGFCVVLGPFSGSLCGPLRVKIKLGTVSLAAHSAGIDLMVVLSVFSERVSNAQTSDVCLQARHWQPSLDKRFPNKLGSWKHFTCYPSIKIHESWELDCACKSMRHSWLLRCRWYEPDAPEIMVLDL